MQLLPRPANIFAAMFFLSSIVLSNEAFSYDCSSLPQFSNGASYNTGARVKNAGSAFQCTVGGWCSIGGAYEPGVGWAASNAWNNLGSCNGTGSSSGGSSGGSSSSSSGGSTGIVTVYQHCNYGGWSAGFNEGSFNLNNIIAAGGVNDDASSIRIPAGYEVTLYQDHNYSGTSIVLTSDTSCLHGFNDVLSSMKVSKSGGGGSCPAWVAGTWYNAGDKVMYNGTAYVAEYENPGYDPVISTWFWEPTSGCGSSSSSSSGGGSSTSSSSGGGGSAEYFITESQFNNLFPGRNSLYSFGGFVEAARTFPSFARTGNTNTRKFEVAAALANWQHETGNFVYTREINQSSSYQDNSWGFGTECYANPGQKYFGRGPTQLSWNGNYCAASKYIFGNASTLINNPDRVATDSKVAWQTALWFWVTQSGAGPQSSHDAIVGSAGFGGTIRSINGSLECDGRRPDIVNNRIANYERILQILGVSDNRGKGC